MEWEKKRHLHTWREFAQTWRMMISKFQSFSDSISLSRSCFTSDWYSYIRNIIPKIYGFPPFCHTGAILYQGSTASWSQQTAVTARRWLVVLLLRHWVFFHSCSWSRSASFFPFSVCLFVCLFACLVVCLFACLVVCLFACSFNYSQVIFHNSMQKSASSFPTGRATSGHIVSKAILRECGHGVPTPRWGHRDSRGIWSCF